MTYQCMKCEKTFGHHVGYATHLRRIHGIAWDPQFAADARNGTKPKTAEPLNPLRHLDTAIAEIDARLAVIREILAVRDNLETEASALESQRDRILGVKQTIAAHAVQVPQEN